MSAIEPITLSSVNHSQDIFNVHPPCSSGNQSVSVATAQFSKYTIAQTLITWNVNIFSGENLGLMFSIKVFCAGVNNSNNGVDDNHTVTFIFQIYNDKRALQFCVYFKF